MHAKLTSRPVAIFATLLLAGIAGVAAALPADATFRGQNGRIAIQRFTDPNDDRSAQIITVRPHGRGVRKLTDFNSGAFDPDFSPNGSRIAFERRFRAAGHDVIFKMRSDGSRVVRLSSGCRGKCLGDAEAAWGPRGRRIAFVRAFGPIVNDNASGLDLMVMRADGSKRRLIRRSPEGREFHEPQWSPDGRRLAVLVLNSETQASARRT
jgi:Tol biopolymer transport system component